MEEERDLGISGRAADDDRLTAADRLTNREREVVRLLRAGKSYKILAGELGIRASTARVLGSRALRKLGGRRLRLPEV